MNAGQEQRRPRSAVAGPVLVAAVFLAIIGGSVGFVLAAGEGGAAGQGQVAEETVAPTPTDPPETGGSGEPPATTPREPADETTDPDHCPGRTEKLAREAGSPGGLERKLYIRTDYSEVWICVDDGGRLFYQGHRGEPGERLVEGTNALFLTDVWTEGAGYWARGSNVRFHVTRDELVIERKGRDPQVEPVRGHRP